MQWCAPAAGRQNKQCLLAAKSHRFDTCIGRNTIQVEACGRPEQIAPRPLGNESEGKIQTRSRTAAMPAPSSTASIIASQPMHELIIM